MEDRILKAICVGAVDRQKGKPYHPPRRPVDEHEAYRQGFLTGDEGGRFAAGLEALLQLEHNARKEARRADRLAVRTREALAAMAANDVEDGFRFEEERIRASKALARRQQEAAERMEAARGPPPMKDNPPPAPPPPSRDPFPKPGHVEIFPYGTGHLTTRTDLFDSMKAARSEVLGIKGSWPKACFLEKDNEGYN